jgi:hypothetical protein
MATKEVKKEPAKKKAVTVKPKTTAGRKTLLTPDAEKEIIESIAVGVPVKDALKDQGVSESAYYNWIKRGTEEIDRLERDPKAIPNPSEVVFVEFVESVERAKSTAAKIHVKNVVRAGYQGDWRASAWWLERQRRDEFGKEAPITVVGTQNNLQINMTVTLAEIQRKLKEIALETNVIESDEQ